MPASEPVLMPAPLPATDGARPADDGSRADSLRAPSRASIFRRRAVSAVVLAPVVLAAALAGALPYGILVLAGGAVMAWEWWRMIGGSGQGGPDRPWLGVTGPWLMVMGLAYVGLAVTALIWLRAGLDAGWITTLWLILVVWATDIGAYACGSLIGGPRLAPRISPGKTWSGAIGGLISGIGIGAVIAATMPDLPAATVLAWSGVASIACQIGDLAESALKRGFRVKDSGRLIPGHGGLLDRMDGMMAAALVVAVASGASGGSVLSWQ